MSRSRGPAWSSSSRPRTAASQNRKNVAAHFCVDGRSNLDFLSICRPRGTQNPGSAFKLQDEFTLEGLQVNVAADAEPGDIEIEVGGDYGDTTVVAGEVQARIDVSATKKDVTVGLSRAAGDITIVETGKDTFAGTELTLTAPKGVAFAGAPTVEVNGKEVDAKVDGDNDEKVVITLEGLRSNRVDTIEISDIELDLDSRVGYGDVVVKIGGSGVNEIPEDEEVNDTDSGSAVARVAIATVVSATQREAVFTIGSNVYTVNGVEYSMDVAPYIKNSRTYLPVRYVAYALGVDSDNVLWDEATKTVTLIKGMNAVQLTIGSNVLKLNGVSITMDVAPELQSGRTMLPFRFIAQAFGASVTWDEATQTVTMGLE